MRHLLFTLLLAALAPTAFAQTVFDYASVEFSPGIRKLGVFGTGVETKVVDLKPINMDKGALDIQNFFREVQALEATGWEVTAQDVVALGKGSHMYVWVMRRPRAATR
jgi:hypothetical protein